ncbi:MULTISPECIES: hypothetical protein [Sphingobacterium]|uniref:hypothetical protein n=1 Tax=Sphingobacterium TaxID=28453 RepID=UPI00257E5AEC|nr:MULTISPECIES: hypothetical protein [Sphingobacterium]
MNALQAVPTIRIRSMDVMRGLTLFLMLFVNDLFIPAVPKWLVHTEADEDGMGWRTGFSRDFFLWLEWLFLMLWQPGKS